MIGDWCAKWRVYCKSLWKVYSNDGAYVDDGMASFRISGDLFHRDFSICKPEETLEFYKNACKSPEVYCHIGGLRENDGVTLRKTGRSATMSEENIRRIGVSGWTIGCPYQRFEIEKMGQFGFVEHEQKDFDRKWITGGFDILTNGGFLKTTFDDYSQSDELGVDNVMEYSLAECIARWNRRFPLYANEADTLYRRLMNMGANGLINMKTAENVAAESLGKLISLRWKLFEQIPNVPFDILAGATFEPFEKRLNSKTTDEEYQKSVKKMENRIALMKAIYSFSLPQKEPHTYDELMDWLETH